MQREYIIAGGLASLALGVAFLFRDKIQDAAADAVGAVAVTRGIRNNNPGNIRVGQSWQGERVSNTDGAFEQFTSPEFGYRALCRILDTYRDRHGLRTINSVINRFAPPTDNNPTSAYAAYVARRLGISPHDYVDTRRPEIMVQIMDAITRFENNGANPFSEAVMYEGVRLARSGAVWT